MKKTTLVLFIIVLSVFISANVAVAKGWKYFKGTYAMSATGSCIHSESGYNWDNFIDAVVPGVVYAGTTVSNGTWVFKKDGTGTYSETIYATVTPPRSATRTARSSLRHNTRWDSYFQFLPYIRLRDRQFR